MSPRFYFSHEPRDDEDNASQINQTREECPEWIDDTDEHSYSPQTVPSRNARKKKSHAVIKRRATTSESSDEDEQSYVIGVVHAWVGQKLLNCFIFKCFTRKTLKKISIGHR
jgi:hypothetical protein